MLITAINNNITKYTDKIRNEKNPININNNDIDIISSIYNKTEFLEKNIKSPINEYKYYNKKDKQYILFRINDPIMYTKNNYEKRLFNGMEGKITYIDNYIDENNETITSITIEKKDSKEKHIFESNDDFIQYLKPSYMITIHKSQGSEADSVLILLTSKYMINKNLLYTAFTRAKKKVCIIATKEVLQYGKTTCINRKSLLDYMIKYYNNDNDFDDFDDYYCNLIKNKLL